MRDRPLIACVQIAVRLLVYARPADEIDFADAVLVEDFGGVSGILGHSICFRSAVEGCATGNEDRFCGKPLQVGGVA